MSANDTAVEIADVLASAAETTAEVATPPESIAPAAPVRSLGRRVFTNTASQVVGRNFIALVRLVIAGLIARSLGKTIFGEYSLVFSLLTISEWVLDFGMTEIFVRDICREALRRQPLMRVLTATKLVQIPMAFALLAAVLFGFHYPSQVIKAGLVGGIGLIFFAVVLIYRVIFKSSLTMGREMMAEFISVSAMVPMVFFVARHNGGLVGLLVCHLLSRIVFCGACYFLGRDSFHISIAGVTFPAVVSSLKIASPIGIIGLLAVVNEVIDILLIARLGTLSDLAYYSGAQRFTAPLLIALASIGATLYPVAATYWPHDPRKFEQACQRGFDTVFLIAGLAITAMLAGPQFFMGLIGPSLLPGAPVLQILALLCFAKTISSALGPVLYILQAQSRVLQFVVLSVVVKAGVCIFLAPRYGALGVAYGAVAVELCLTAVPAMLLIGHYSGCRLNWLVPLKVFAITLVAVAVARFLPSPRGLLAAFAAPIFYTLFAFLVGAASLANLRLLLHRNAT